MNRVVLIVVLLAGVTAAAAFLLLRAKPDPAPRAAAGQAPSATSASRAQSGDADLTPEPSVPAAAPVRRRAAPAPAPPTSPARLASPIPSAPASSVLRVVSDVAGAQVFVDREFVGTTPATLKDLAPGTHQLNVAAPGFDNHVETIELAAGEREVVVNFKAVRLDASLAVIHKHRLGSCRGRLVATPQGVRYETTDKDDTFSAPLLDLETFDIDYLNKNLRIQPRKGKRYDFTDTEGNADRLFVFHRDVERARERLRNP